MSKDATTGAIAVTAPASCGWTATSSAHRGGLTGGVADPAPRSEVLTIRFVRAVDGRVSGALTPYWDPDRQCEATATFDGAVTGARIEGTFLSVCEGGVLAYRGHWTMHRKTLRRADTSPAG